MKWRIMWYAGAIVSIASVMHWDGDVSLDTLIVGLALMATAFTESKYEQRGKM